MQEIDRNKLDQMFAYDFTALNAFGYEDGSKLQLGYARLEPFNLSREDSFKKLPGIVYWGAAGEEARSFEEQLALLGSVVGATPGLEILDPEDNEDAYLKRVFIIPDQDSRNSSFQTSKALLNVMDNLDAHRDGYKREWAQRAMHTIYGHGAIFNTGADDIHKMAAELKLYVPPPFGDLGIPAPSEAFQSRTPA